MLSLIQDFPAIKRVRWFNVSVLVITPAIAVYGLFCVQPQYKTLLFAVLYYIFSMLGELSPYPGLIAPPNYSSLKVLRPVCQIHVVHYH